MTFTAMLPFVLVLVLILLGILLFVSFINKKKLYIIVLIPCIIFVGVSMLFLFISNSTTSHIQDFETFSLDDFSRTNEILDQSLLTETDFVTQEIIDQVQISNLELSFHNGLFSNLTYSFLVATDIYPLEKIVQINYVGDIFSEPSRGIGNETYVNQLISCGDLKKVLSIISDSKIIREVSSKAPTQMDLSFVGIIDIGTISIDTDEIYVIIQDEIVPMSDIEYMTQTPYFVFNVIFDADNIWICY